MIKTLFSKIFFNIKKHPFFSVIIIAQIAFIFVLLTASIIEPRKIIVTDMNSFKVEDTGARIDDGKLELRNSDNVDGNVEMVVSSAGMAMRSGAYDVTVAYQLESDDEDVESAEVSLSSVWRIDAETINLDSRSNSATSKLWIPFLTACGDLRINVVYGGKAALTINSITFTESLRYRFARIVGFMLAFLLCDLLIATFFTSIKIPLRKHHAALLLIVFAASLPFFARTLFVGHDLRFHVLRIVSLAEELSYGQFPVRMATELNNGYGYPTSIYYCDFFLYPVALLYRMQVPLRICYQIYVILMNVMTVVFTYFALGKFTKKTKLRLLGTALYVLCIYRLVDINVRSAAGEYTAMAFLPLIVAGLYMIYTKEKPQFKDWIYLAIGMAGVVLSHVVTGEMITINILLFCLIMIKKTLKKERLLALLKAAALCLGLTFWFLLPFVDYYLHHTTFVQSSDFRPLGETTVELINLLQLFSPGKDAGNYITIGLPFVAGLALVLYCLFSYRRRRSRGTIVLLRVIGGMTLLNMVVVCNFFPWGQIQRLLWRGGIGYQLGTIQFAWRFLSIASILLVFAIVVSLDLLSREKIRRARCAYFCLIGCIIFSVGFFYYRFADESGRANYNTMSAYAYSDNLYLLDGTDRTIQEFSEPRVINGNVKLGGSNRDGDAYFVEVKNLSNEVAALRLPIYDYRYFNAYSNDGALLEQITADSNCVTVVLPAQYEGKVIIKFEEPMSWRMAEMISLLCAMGAGVWYARHSTATHKQ